MQVLQLSLSLIQNFCLIVRALTFRRQRVNRTIQQNGTERLVPDSRPAGHHSIYIQHQGQWLIFLFSDLISLYCIAASAAACRRTENNDTTTAAAQKSKQIRPKPIGIDAYNLRALHRLSATDRSNIFRHARPRSSECAWMAGLSACHGSGGDFIHESLGLLHRRARSLCRLASTGALLRHS